MRWLLWMCLAWLVILPAGAEELQFKVGPDTIYATLELPHQPKGAPPKKFPAVLLLSGSGPTDRDGNTPVLPGRVNSHRWMAEMLAQHGIASLRFDKLFSGRTGMATHKVDYAQLGFDSTVDVARAAWLTLKSRPEVDPQRLGIVGHSEGGLVALILAGSEKPVCVGLLAPISQPYLVTVREQIARSYRNAKHPDADAAIADLDSVIAEVTSKGTTGERLRPELKKVFSPAVLRFFHTVAPYDPGQLLAALPATMGVFIAAGERDLQILPSDVQKMAGSRPVLVVPKANHVFKVSAEPRADGLDYGDPSAPFAVELEKGLCEFLSAQLRP